LAQIKIGAIDPYTGIAKEYASIARAETAYFQMADDRGGVNGSKIEFISVDNASDPSPYPWRASWSNRMASCLSSALSGLR
jgi:ABC-type branched-subunit amino acid transport system substrate-binding protein